MIPRIAQKSAPPVRSFRTGLLLEPVPWLMLAAAARIVHYGGGFAFIPAEITANATIFIAFLVTARRMIEFADGKTALGYLSFRQQLWLSHKVLQPVGILVVAVYVIAGLVGGHVFGAAFYFGFDGIAFDQRSDIGRIWSATLAALILIMVMRSEHGQAPSIPAALRELVEHWKYMLAAVIAVALFHIAFSPIQGWVRWEIYQFWKTSGAPEFLKRAIYFTYIFSFAAIRLWITVAILTLALRASYRRTTPATPD